MKQIFGVLVLSAVCCLFSCEEPQRKTLTKYERELVDSLYSKRVNLIKKEADSICDARYDMIFNETVDSLKIEYLNEIENMFYEEG